MRNKRREYLYNAHGLESSGSSCVFRVEGCNGLQHNTGGRESWNIDLTLNPHPAEIPYTYHGGFYRSAGDLTGRHSTWRLLPETGAAAPLKKDRKIRSAGHKDGFPERYCQHAVPGTKEYKTRCPLQAAGCLL